MYQRDRKKIALGRPDPAVAWLGTFEATADDQSSGHFE